MEESIFTKIIKGEVPGEVIYEDDISAVLLTIEPITAGHMLVVPKVEIDSVWNIDGTTYHHLWNVAKQMADKLDRAYDYIRIGTFVEGFGVPHAHIHVFGYEQPLEPTIIEHHARKHQAGAGELKQVADRLRAV